MNKSIDINCDLGESLDPTLWQKDAALMPYISSCNIACGGHAGNHQSICTAVANAVKYDVSIGAHPSYPDPDNFGRHSMLISDTDLRRTLAEQIGLLLDVCKQKKINMRHVKPHGAIYNDAASDLKLAILIAEEVAKLSPQVKLMGLAESAMCDAAKSVGLPFIHEGFMDRNYTVAKTLVPRSENHAVHGSIEESLLQALHLAQQKPILTPCNTELSINVDSICLHGDNPQALDIAQKLYQLLRDNHISIKPSKA